MQGWLVVEVKDWLVVVVEGWLVVEEEVSLHLVQLKYAVKKCWS